MRRSALAPSLLALTACAVTTLPPEPPPAAAPVAAPVARDAGVPSRDLGGAEGVVRLCEALRDEEDIAYEGNEVQRARSREEHRARRAQAAEGSYLVLVPSAGFAFRSYDLGEKRLVVDGGRSFALADGVEVVPADPAQTLAFDLGADAAERLLKEHAAGRLKLRLLVRPAPSEMRKDGCMRVSGGRVVKLPADVLAFALVGADGAPVARGAGGDMPDEPAVTPPVRTPEVSIGKPRGGDGRDVAEPVAAAARALAPQLLPCYQEALRARPGLRGLLVLELRVAGDGRIESAREEMSSVRDEALVSCARARLGKARLEKVSGPVRMSLPVTFGAREDH